MCEKKFKLPADAEKRKELILSIAKIQSGKPIEYRADGKNYVVVPRGEKPAK